MLFTTLNAMPFRIYTVHKLEKDALILSPHRTGNTIQSDYEIVAFWPHEMPVWNQSRIDYCRLIVDVAFV